MIRVYGYNISRCYFLNKRKLDYAAKFVLKSAGVDNATLSIVFASDAEIKRLNYLYRRKKKATDVLSFSMQEGKYLERDSSILGDVVISIDRAKKQASRFKSTFKKEIYLYIIHGILHLLGYDDKSPSSRKMMQRKETEVLTSLWQRVK